MPEASKFEMAKYMQEARRYVESGQFELAERAYEAGLSHIVEGVSPHNLYNVGVDIFVNLGDYQRALECADKIIALLPRSVLGYDSKAYVLSLYLKRKLSVSEREELVKNEVANGEAMLSLAIESNDKATTAKVYDLLAFDYYFYAFLNKRNLAEEYAQKALSLNGSTSTKAQRILAELAKGKKHSQISVNAHALAMKTAQRLKRQTDKIKVPYIDNYQYTQVTPVEIKEKKLFFTVTKTVQRTEVVSGTRIKYREVDIGGWILKKYDEIANTYVQDGLIQKEVTTTLYALKPDGNLLVCKMSYGLRKAKPSDSDFKDMYYYYPLSESPMSFEPPTKWNDGTNNIGSLLDSNSAFIADYEDGWWESGYSKAGSSERVVIKRNCPKFISEGNSKLYGDGEGILHLLRQM